MADNLDKDGDILGDNWLTHWENQCLEEWEAEAILDDTIQHETDNITQKLWLAFQNSATSIAQLYKEAMHQNRVSLWAPFQNSAASVTTLFRDGQDAIRRSFELGTQLGCQRRTRELLAWTRKRRRRIHRDELIAHLSGRATPARHRPTPSFMRTPSRLAVELSGTRLAPPSPGSVNNDSSEPPDLQPFSEALALHGLNGAMSSITVGRRSSSTQASGGSTAAAAAMADDLHGFILSEIARRCESRKRAASGETRLDSPSHKRSKTSGRGSDSDTL